MRRFVSYLPVQLLLLTSFAQAQVVGAPDAPTKGVGNYFSDRRFINDAMQLGMAEMAMSRLAAGNSNSQQIKDFAVAVLKDHTRTDAELRDLASRKDIKTPSKPEASRAETVQKLEAKKAADFDAEYLAESRNDLAKAISIYQSETDSTDPAFAEFAKKTLILLRERESMAQKLGSGSTPP